MSNVDAPDVNSGETNNPDLLAEQSGMPNMSSTKTFTVDTNMQVNGDLDVTGTVTATSFVGDGSQLTGISGGTGGGGLDSAAVTLLVDSDYVQARETPQDFAYSSLTGAPTALSSFTNDTSYITAADIPTTVDSAYVQSRVTLDGVGLDSAGVTALVDSDYVAARAPAASGGLDSAAVISLTGTEVQTSAGGIDYSAQSRLRVEDGAIGLSTIDADAGAESLTYSGTTWQLAGNPVGASSQRITHHLWSSSYTNASLTAANDVYVGTRYAGTKFSYPSMKSYVPTAAQFGGGFEWDQAGTTVLDLSTDGAVFSSSVTATSFIGDGSGLTNLPSGGGLDSAAVQGVVDDNLLGGVSNTGVVIGPSATADATKLQMTVIGPSATTNGAYNVAIGRSASVQSGEENAVAIGNQARAGFSTGGLGGVSIGNSSTVQYDYGVAVGMLAEVKNAHGVALGYQAEVTGSRGIAIGSNAFAQGSFSTALGQNAQSYGQNSLTIGYGAGNTTGGDNAVLIGTNAGQSAHQRLNVVAVGMNAQLTNDANVSATVAVGYDAGKTRQESSTVAIGYKAGETDQLNSATAVGYQAGNTSQGGSSVAIGRDAAFTGQATNSVAIGRAAGYENQGTRSIAIGRQAGALNQGDNNIILNATSAALDRTDQFGIDIRTSAAGSLTYDTTNDWTFGAGVTMTDLTASGATVVFSNLPTTDPVNAGQLWNDNGTLKVSAG